jgi:hypothetical protein
MSPTYTTGSSPRPAVASTQRAKPGEPVEVRLRTTERLAHDAHRLGAEIGEAVEESAGVFKVLVSTANASAVAHPAITAATGSAVAAAVSSAAHRGPTVRPGRSQRSSIRSTARVAAKFRPRDHQTGQRPVEVKNGGEAKHRARRRAPGRIPCRPF